MSCLIWIYGICKFSYCCVWRFTGLLVYQCCLLITFANSLDPDQARQIVWPDHVPLYKYVCILKKMILKKSSRRQKRMQNYVACKEITDEKVDPDFKFSELLKENPLNIHVRSVTIVSSGKQFKLTRNAHRINSNAIIFWVLSIQTETSLQLSVRVYANFNYLAF